MSARLDESAAAARALVAAVLDRVVRALATDSPPTPSDLRRVFGEASFPTAAIDAGIGESAAPPSLTQLRQIFGEAAFPAASAPLAAADAPAEAASGPEAPSSAAPPDESRGSGAPSPRAVKALGLGLAAFAVPPPSPHKAASKAMIEAVVWGAVSRSTDEIDDEAASGVSSGLAAPPAPQAPSPPEPRGPPRAQCYLVYAPTDGGSLFLMWSLKPVKGALATCVPELPPGKGLPGRCELAREISLGRKYYEGCDELLEAVASPRPFLHPAPRPSCVPRVGGGSSSRRRPTCTARSRCWPAPQRARARWTSSCCPRPSPSAGWRRRPRSPACAARRWSPRGGRACRAARAWAPRSSASRLGRRAGSRLSFETRARQQTQRHRGSGGAPRRVPVGRALLVTLRVVLYGECGSWSRLTRHRFGPGREPRARWRELARRPR
ncbi:hypothetical protein EMIHUDRAFT_449891 [Emiliania huxleyi CCMP1516]|uniref:Immune mapped protein 2 N-terminal domain-containing protein n=2 Tax=Emiliania huxleyi TaxID=2903 RepID=A0A0D3K0U0_EMIH1|nr:hypothetical protein EMIHUDRAFT_449891 [Emiliania huxleyi CCMP1516]EOD29375.1 hypothetical protein EMIHUDRAFT_449891 [Emiliania huxleyi CCMP1516]|eukprot:XP_005781804.1 hypothetical protein EMIHUDRAFT_449891 [Emiliania huxleyi CCMP1516]